MSGAEDSVVGTLGKVVLGGAVGFALVFVVTGLGGRGRGRGRGVNRGEGASEEAPLLPVVSPPIPPSRPKDDKRLSFVMIEPKTGGHVMGFRRRDGESSKIYSLKELITRVRDGGRTDVDLGVSGAVMHGPWGEALALIKRAGLTVGLTEPLSGLPVSVGWYENNRGQYKRGF